MLPEIVIVVGETYWQCVTCRLTQKRTLSLDEHLKESHSHIPVPSPEVSAAAGLAVSGEEASSEKDIGKKTLTRGRRATKTQEPLTQDTEWLKKPDSDDTSDDEVDNDDDSDFIPSEVDSKSSRARSLLSQRSQRKQPKKDIIKRVKVRLPRKDTVTNSKPGVSVKHELLSDFQPPTDPEQTGAEKEEEVELTPKLKQGRPSGTSLRIPRGKQGRKRASQTVPVENKVPKKRGRPPKPKPVPAEGEDLPPKRPYRKRVPDPSELLLKIRNVGRKPNSRKKLLHEEKEGMKTRYIKLISKTDTGVDVAENNSLNKWDDHEGRRSISEQNVCQNNVSCPDSSRSSPALQQTDVISQEKIRCGTCMYLFSSEKLLKEHFMSVSEEDVVQCTACEMKFHGLVDINMHVFCDHEYEKQPVCFQCREDFRSMEKLEKHLHSQHKGEPDRKLTDTKFHDCRLCHMELNVDFQLIKNHYYRRHKAYVCPECYGKDVELLFYTDTHLYSEHKQMHAKSPAECTICHMVFPTAREMKAHMWTHASDTTEDGTGGKCSKCEKWLPNSGAMLMHEKEHKNEAIRKNYALEASIGFPCMKCEHIFSSKSNLKKHSCKADPNRTFYFHCEYCAHGCNTKEQLRDHIALHHLGIKRYACDYCDQRFVCAPTLRRHVRRLHTKEKPYECHLCKERFYERNLMLRHVSKHTGIASFMCEFCGKGFHTKFDLKKHVENHTDTRDFVCPNCGLDYKRSYHLKRHLEKGCKKKSLPSALDENIPFVKSEPPLAAQEDPDEMLYLDLANDIGTDEDGNESDMDNYNQDESSGPDLVKDDDDDDDDEIV